MEENLDSIIRKLALSSNTKICITDVFKDEISIYKVLDGKPEMEGKHQLTSYLEGLQNSVNASYLKGVMEMFSIPKFKEESKNGNDKVKFKYQDLNNKWHNITAMLVKKDSELIFSIIEDEDGTKNALVPDEKFNSLVSNLSDAMLKIYNSFDIKINNLEDIKKIEEYINTILSGLSNKYPELKKSFKENALDVSSMTYDTILIVDDDLVTRNMIKKVFQDEYKISMATNGKEAIEYLEENKNKSKFESSDNVLGIFLDLTMPVMDGFAVLEYLSKNNYLSKIPVIIISGDYERETKMRVYNYNIADMLEKPFDFDVVRHRIGNFINLYKSSNALTNLVSGQGEKLKDLIDAFVRAYESDYEDNIRKIKNYIMILGSKVKEDYPEYALTDELVEKMADASKYYDIGFYSIPRKILNKKENLNEEELRIIKEYPLFGNKMTEYILSLTSDMKYKDYACNIVKYYHENYDGTGYPNGLKESNIPLEAQIASLVIMYNNLARRVSNPAEIIISKTNKAFSPKLIKAFEEVKDEFLTVK